MVVKYNETKTVTGTAPLRLHGCYCHAPITYFTNLRRNLHLIGKGKELRVKEEVKV